LKFNLKLILLTRLILGLLLWPSTLSYGFEDDSSLEQLKLLIIPKQEILNKLGTIKSKQEIYHEALIEKILVIKELIGNNSEYLIFIQDIEGIINYFKASNLPHIQNIKSLDSNNMFQLNNYCDQVIDQLDKLMKKNEFRDLLLEDQNHQEELDENTVAIKQILLNQKQDFEIMKIKIIAYFQVESNYLPAHGNIKAIIIPTKRKYKHITLHELPVTRSGIVDEVKILMEIADNNTPIELYSSRVKEIISRVTQFLIINKSRKAKSTFRKLIKRLRWERRSFDLNSIIAYIINNSDEEKSAKLITYKLINISKEIIIIREYLQSITDLRDSYSEDLRVNEDYQLKRKKLRLLKRKFNYFYLYLADIIANDLDLKNILLNNYLILHSQAKKEIMSSEFFQ
jgi:hypothetical protein